MNTLVSIIIPTYNRAHLICETLDSILAQTYTHWECVIVDDGSIDETEKVISKYVKKDNRFQYHQRPVNRIKGANTCRNYGFELSKGKYIKWFDSDDEMLPNLLEKQICSFQGNTEMSVCKLSYFDFDKGISIKENVIFSNHLIEDYLIGMVTFYISGPLWKRSFLEKQTKLFDESITNLDDWDFNLRMLYQEPSVVFIDEALIKYRVHEASLSQEINRLNFNEIQSEYRAIEKHLLLIKENKKSDQKILKKHFKNRCQFILRETMVKDKKNKFYFFKKLLIIQFQLFKFPEMIKTIAAFFVFVFFKKGYKFL